ncbi:hypothetical protein MESMUL_23060 [Mesosutterella multiformis]|uniref:Molybdopterin oxidoreductase domain-containing protein n=1 Tax=Mesosutterella multiformis TaxID=2259133 RepID=A0A388SEY2_9BURK|nr:hypothetical protein [Mesosutterella multiformis]GBO94952.1 hypothetical protein MESMUL_23060 [Mesosutterella multiformis]
MVSILKEWYGENATVENDYGYDWMPKLPHEYRDASMIPTWNRMRDGKVKGYFVWGMNPAHFAPNASNARRGLSRSSTGWLSPISSRRKPPTSGRNPGSTSSPARPKSIVCRP